MVFQNDILAGSSGGTGTSSAVHTIGQSIRFNSADSAYMHRTPSSTGNRKTFTSSFWFKRGKLGTDMYLGCPNVSNSGYAYGMYFASDDSIYVWIYYSGSAWQGQLYTNRLFRDPSAWYHIVLNVDTTQAVSTERVRIYVNGQRETSFATENYPNQNQDTSWNVSGTQMNIGSLESGAFFDGYLAEIHFLDGYAYDPSYFGLFNQNGIWIPKEYSGSYGTNGYKIDGRDSADLGDDESGNGNDFTTSGLASHDQMVGESPTNNFCTYNSIQLQSGATLSNGNLDAVSSGSSWRNVHSTIGVSSGKWYWEVKADVINSSQTWVAGIQETSFESKANYWWQAGYTASSSGIVFGVLDSNYKVTNVTRTSFTHDIAQGDIVQFQLNLDDNELTVLVDGVSKGKIYDITANTEYTPAVCLYSTSSATINFGQDGTFGGTETAGGNSDGNGIGNFKYSVPSGYLALCTKNLGS